MPPLQGKNIRGIDGNWEHIMSAHDVTEAEVISVFKSGPLRPKKNKKSGSADYMIIGKAFTGRLLHICYSWDDKNKGWIWVHTAF
ncbi:MAG: hypothetical protein IPJ69_02590 [Deltaproteobacteria bacterium]|nr:MAG: hypothetical protein IPJ69_02590 [Deltaproteobacteria bacterium]